MNYISSFFSNFYSNYISLSYSFFRKNKKYLFVFLSFVCLSVWAVAKNSESIKEKYEKLKIFVRVLHIIEQNYVEEVDINQLVYGAIEGVLEKLDPHTNFLPPETFKDFSEETSGNFSGIGIEITKKEERVLIISPIEDSPAWKEGILSGDEILKVDGTPVKGLSLIKIGKLLKGKVNTKVTLDINRGEKKEVFQIKRSIIHINPVKYVNLGEGLGYFRLISFIENCSIDLKKKIEQHRKKHGLRGAILDLRYNPGGLLEEAVRVSDLFLSKGVIVSTRGRDKKDEKLFEAKDSSLGNFPLIVLVNSSSASASEIVTAALKDNKRALVVGEKTFGKGSVQSVIKLEDGSGLKITVSLYYTPSGISINKVGVEPNIFVSQKALKSNYKKILLDPYVKSAYDHLKSWKTIETFKQSK